MKTVFSAGPCITCYANQFSVDRRFENIFTVLISCNRHAINEKHIQELVGKSERKGQLGRPRHRGEDNFIMARK